MARLTKTAIERDLLAGVPIKWRDSNGKERRFALETSEQRRLFAFLLKSRVREPKGLQPEFIAALAQSHDAEDDPALNRAEVSESSAKLGPWRLQQIRAEGFGGLNLWDGDVFNYDFKQESLLIEGPNGSGKSSLIGAIVWGLTGERPRDYSDTRAHEAQTVYTENDKSAGDWPPIACYPPTTEELNASVPRVRVELTFGTPTGEVATISRTLEGEKLDVERDHSLDIPSILLEAGVLMPARLAQIRLKVGQSRLTDAVKKLTGLDELSNIGSLVDGLCHKGREYLSYARSQDLSTLKVAFEAYLEEARTALEPVSVTIRAFTADETDNPKGPMAELGKDLASHATNLTKIIADDLSPDLDFHDTKVQKRIAIAIQAVREKVLDGLPALPTWRLLGVLAADLNEDATQRLTAAISTARQSLATAVDLHTKNNTDSRLRIKAIAARWHAENISGSILECPLCDQPLEGYTALATELEELKYVDEAAARSFQDNMNAACATLDSSSPQILHLRAGELLNLKPRAMILNDLQTQLVQHIPDAILLRRFVGMVTNALPQAPPGQPQATSTEVSGDLPEGADILLRKIAAAEVALNLAAWFRAEVNNWESWWEKLSKNKSDTPTGKENLSPEALLTHLSRLTDAIDAATPYRVAAEAMRRAWQHGKECAKIEREQNRREVIAESLLPLKNLGVLAESIAQQAITELSGRISSILDAIHLSERFRFYAARLDRKEGVVVRGGFDPELRIDATLVANTSWLRATLWAFLFALREEAVEQLGYDSFPIMLFDDPQATFDAEHRHRWAQYVAGLQGGEIAVQIIVTTFDETFLDLVKMDGVTGRHALIAGASPELGHVGLFEGEALDRKWEEVKKTNTPLAARSYMMDVRIHLECMLKLMLRGEDRGISMFTVNDLREKLKQLRGAGIPPWNNPAFKVLLGALDRGIPEMRFIEAAHHTTGMNLGLAEARSVEKHWRKTLRPELERGFRIARDYRLLHGGLKALHAPSPAAILPEGYQSKVRNIRLNVLGRAAALTNGRAADGCMNWEEFSLEDYSPIILGHHSAYRLTAATLEPVARPGDILLVKEHTEPSSRSLVVAVSGDHIVARRYELSENVSDVAVLTAQSINPRKIAAPLIAQKSTLKLHKVVGVLFDDSNLTATPTDVEICDCGGEATLARLASNAIGLVEVIGQSAEPLALNGQYILISSQIGTATALKNLDGKPVIAADEEDNRYFKRLRIAGTMIILESLDSGGDFPPIILSLPGERSNGCLTRVWPVVGVLFDLSN